MSAHFSKTLFLARQCEQHHLMRCARIHPLSPASVDFQKERIASQVRRHLGKHTRCFSSTPQRQASPPTKKPKEAPRNNMLEKMRAAMKQAEREGGLPEDVGYQSFFIMPFGRNLPSFTSNPRGRLKLERKRFKDWAEQTGYGLFYRYWYVRPKPRLQLRKIAPVAEELHQKMYVALAEGNLASVERFLLGGMMGSLRGRIAERPAGTQLKWTLHKYLSKSKLVSWRPILFPAKQGEKSTERRGIVQAVVRIHTSQSLQHVRRRPRGNGEFMEILVDSQGRELASQDPKMAERHAKQVVEYLVLQKVIRNSKEGPWKLQGFAEESTLEKLERVERAQKGRSVGRTAAAT